MIFRFFQKAATQRGVVLEITPVGGVKFFLKKAPKNLNAFKNSGNIPVGQIFEKSSEKARTLSDFLAIYPLGNFFWENVEKARTLSNFLEIYLMWIKNLQKSSTHFRIFGNIPKESVNVFRLFPYVLSIAIPRKEPNGYYRQEEHPCP